MLTALLAFLSRRKKLLFGLINFVVLLIRENVNVSAFCYLKTHSDLKEDPKKRAPLTTLHLLTFLQPLFGC